MLLLSSSGSELDELPPLLLEELPPLLLEELLEELELLLEELSQQTVSQHIPPTPPLAVRVGGSPAHWHEELEDSEELEDPGESEELEELDNLSQSTQPHPLLLLLLAKGVTDSLEICESGFQTTFFIKFSTSIWVIV